MPQEKTVESEVDDMVLTYDEYMAIKEKFRTAETSSSEIERLDEFLQKANITGDTKEHYLDAFILLLKYIQSDGAFFYGNTINACKYINYILYKAVEYTINRSFDKNLSKHFQNLLVAYGNKLPQRSNRCITDIYNIQRQTYNIINPLYELYEKNKECSNYVDNIVPLVCHKFEDFFDLYNKYMLSTEPKSLKFYEILQNIEKHAKDVFSKYRKGCTKYTNDPLSPKLFIPPPVKEPKIRNEEQMHETKLQSVDSTSHHGTHEISHKQQAGLTNDIPRPQPIQEYQGTHEGNSVHVIHSADDSYRGRSHLEKIDTPMRADEDRTQVLPNFPNPIGYSYSSGTSLYSGHDGNVREQPFSKEEELSPPSMMSTITGVLGSVEPAPILGVSGGMGVLFLLFKYTPVGSFFGGRRGRFRQIPRTFNGPFPGDFPNFQEYDGGFIGYSPMGISPLAE